MASETPVSDHPATSQQHEVEKDLESELKHKAIVENVSAPTDKEPPCPAPAPAAAADPEKPIVPLAAAEEKKPEVAADPSVIESTDEVQKEAPKLAELIAEEKIEDKPPAEDKKIEDVIVPEEKPEAKLNEKLETEPVKEVKGEEKHQESETTVEELPAPKAAETNEVKDAAVSEDVCTPGEPVAPSAEAKLPEVVEQVEKEPVAEKVDTCTAEGLEQIKADKEKEVVEKAPEKAGEAEEVKEPATPQHKAEEVKPQDKSVVVAQELVQCNQKPDDSVTVAEPAAEPEVASRDIEPVVVAAAAVEKPEAAIEAKPEEAKLVDEPEKTDITTKTTQEEGKGDPTTTKPQKPSLVKLMKRTLVKAKKAIIGKSNQSAKGPESKEQGNK